MNIKSLPFPIHFWFGREDVGGRRNRGKNEEETEVRTDEEIGER